MVMNRRLHSAAGSAVALALLVAASGCATNGYVRTQVAESKGYTDSQVGEVRANLNQTNGNLEQVRGNLDQVKTLAERLASGNVEFAEISTHQVQFAFDDWRLQPDAQSAVDGLAAELASHPRYALEIRGFADATGNDRYNYKLGRERADEVVRYLVTKDSVPMSRIATVSFGEESPSADNSTREGRAQNRRVQVRLLEIKSPGEPVASAP